MAVKIRMARHGSHKRPFYRIVVADSRSPRDGRFIEKVGHYNPFNNELKIERKIVLEWLNKGAKPSESVRSLLKQFSIMEEYHCSKTGKKFEGSTERTEPTKKNYKEKKVARKAAAAAATATPAPVETPAETPAEAPAEATEGSAE